MNIIWGISALNHDASITVMHGNEILFAGHAERYSRIKNDPYLNDSLVYAAREFGEPSEIVWFEKHLSKRVRQAYAGQWDEVRSISPTNYLKKYNLHNIPFTSIPHHLSHAAAGYFTSKFKDAAIMVVDAIGEWDTISVWHGKDSNLRKIHSVKYPNSIGLLYSAMTQRVGLKPNEEEYILMGMAAYGQPKYTAEMYDTLINDMTAPNFKLKENLHRGCKWWKPELTTEQDFMDIAASVQYIVEEFMIDLAAWAASETDSCNLVLMGGVALNCVANEKIANELTYDDIWIMPNPGDAGSSLGCILAHTQKHANWTGPYLGTCINQPFNTNGALSALLNGEIIGVATGRAEFGPRALGNRSILADPRGPNIKDRVNDIKQRQRFRPFAPIVLEHLAHEYFELPFKSSPYMQFVSYCKYPDLFPAVCHVDGTSRVQTLNREQNPVIYELLEKFYNETGCPMLLNTSLNIKGQPLVDSWEDAIEFQHKHKINIF